MFADTFVLPDSISFALHGDFRDVDVGYPLCGGSNQRTDDTDSPISANYQSPVSSHMWSDARACRSYVFARFFSLFSIAMSSAWYAAVLLPCLLACGCHCVGNVTNVAEQAQTENALAKLVKLFSKPGAFKRVSKFHVESDATYACAHFSISRTSCMLILSQIHLFAASFRYLLILI